MIERINALRTSDGKMFAAEDEALALEYECRTALERCIGKPCATEIMNKLLPVHHAIAPLASFIMARQEREPKGDSDVITPAEHYFPQNQPFKDSSDA